MQYEKMEPCDIDDDKAIISINSDASSFQFRQQGKEDVVKRDAKLLSKDAQRRLKEKQQEV